MAVGKDGETGPYRNSTVNNGGESSAKGRNLFVNQYFICPLQSGIFDLTTYLPTDRKNRPTWELCPWWAVNWLLSLDAQLLKIAVIP